MKRPWSLAARLAATYALCAFTLLALTNLVLFRALEANFDREDDEFLTLQITELRALLQRDALQHPGATPEPAPELSSGLAGREAIAPLQGAHFRRVILRNRIMVETPGMSVLPPAAFRGGQSELWAQNRLFRLKSAALDGREIQVALDKSKDFALLRRYAGQMLWVLAGGLVVSAGVGYGVARRGLAPLDAIGARMRAVEAERLHVRLGAQPWPRELTGLAASFDAMLDRLETAFEKLRRFSADLAHELRTPLSVLRGEAEVALSRPRSNEELRAVLESGLEELARLSQMSEALLFLARAENGAAPPHKAPLDARRELVAVAAYFEAEADERGVALQVKGESFGLEADAVLLRRALANLVSNALRHTPRGGQIVIRAGAPDGEAVFTVQDSGTGIAPQHLPRVFDRFYRADSARARGENDLRTLSGAGLGLSIVASIAALHGGRVELEGHSGENPERGTLARLILPR